MKFFLDTSVLVGVLRNKARTKDLFLDAGSQGDLFISVIAYAELCYSANRADDGVKEKKKITELLKEFNIQLIGISQEAVQIYADSRFVLESQGERLDDFDLLIGATTVAESGILVTDNVKYFSRFPNLKLYK